MPNHATEGATAFMTQSHDEGGDSGLNWHHVIHPEQQQQLQVMIQDRAWFRTAKKVSARIIHPCNTHTYSR